MKRGMTKLCTHVYLVLSVRRAMETLVNASRPKTNLHAYACIPRSKRQTSNGDACKVKQTKTKPTCACIPRSKCQMSNGDAYSNASRRKTNLNVHVYLVLSVRRAMETLVNLNRRKNKAAHACIPHSKHQTSNEDACKLKQTKN